MKYIAIVMILILASMAGCRQGTTASATTQPAAERAVASSVFNADSAYAYVAQQVQYGPRVPGSDASKQCEAWIAEKLSQFGASDIQQQRTRITAWDGTTLDICNISARFNPDAKRRVLLLAHWDSRPWADQETDPKLRRQPIPGANDGASGVGVIMELARVYSQIDTDMGLDVLFVDAEDYGVHQDADVDDSQDSWCLGTQYWVKHPTVPLKNIEYAVLLDMVGDKDAKFSREYHSQIAAAPINDLVWRAARKAGHGKRFADKVGAAVMDDHVPLLMAGVPAIDIVDATNPVTDGFPRTWHTMADDIDNIDPATLRAVGETLVQLLKN